MYRQSEKIAKRQYLFHISLQYTELRPIKDLRSVGEFGAPKQISTGFSSWLRCCTDVARRTSTTFARRLAVSCAGILYMHFRGALAR